MDVLQVSKIAVSWEVYLCGVLVVHIADKLGVHGATVHGWIGGIEETEDLGVFLDKYLSAKRGERAERKADAITKRLVWRLREEHNHCCGQKIKYFLGKDYNLKLGTTTIYKILSDKYQLRTKWKKNKERGPVPKAKAPREVVQMDTVDFWRCVCIYWSKYKSTQIPQLTQYVTNWLNYYHCTRPHIGLGMRPPLVEEE